jgi:phosphatidylglycerol:prolipoprotein diacylglycerol transferase
MATLYFGYRHDFNRAQMLNIGDLLACAAPIGLFLGRMANFVNGELWGRVTNGPWGVIFCNEHLRQAYGQCLAGDMPRHPSQLYEAGLEGLLLFIILFIMSRPLKLFARPGLIMGTFITGYGLFRILLENVREPDAQIPVMFGGHLTMGMILSLPMVIVGLAWINYALRDKLQKAV